MKRRLALLTAMIVALSACGGGGSAPPPSPKQDEQPISVPTVDPAMATPLAFDLELAPERPHSQEVPVVAGEVAVEIRHAGGAVGKMTLEVFDAAHPLVPISSDDITCAEPGCSFRVTVSVAPTTRTLVVHCKVSAAMAIHLDIARCPSACETKD